LVVTVFVLLILAALATFAFRIALNQQETATFDLLNTRAQAAADSGIEYGANMVLKGSWCLLPTSRTFALTAASLTGFTVTVTCSVTLHQIGAGPTTYHAYALQSTAQRGTYGSAEFVARTSTRTVTDAP
jgi:Tfp pilus assembly protein PilX